MVKSYVVALGLLLGLGLPVSIASMFMGSKLKSDVFNRWLIEIRSDVRLFGWGLGIYIATPFLVDDVPNLQTICLTFTWLHCTVFMMLICIAAVSTVSTTMENKIKINYKLSPYEIKNYLTLVNVVSSFMKIMISLSGGIISFGILGIDTSMIAQVGLIVDAIIAISAQPSIRELIEASYPTDQGADQGDQ